MPSVKRPLQSQTAVIWIMKLTSSCSFLPSLAYFWGLCRICWVRTGRWGSMHLPFWPRSWNWVSSTDLHLPIIWSPLPKAIAKRKEVVIRLLILTKLVEINCCAWCSPISSSSCLKIISMTLKNSKCSPQPEKKDSSFFKKRLGFLLKQNCKGKVRTQHFKKKSQPLFSIYLYFFKQ